MKTYPNQKVILMGGKQPFTGKDGNFFSRRHIEAEAIAINQLTHSGLKLWLYLSKNADRDKEGNPYRFALSQKGAEYYSLPESSYRRAVNELIENGYLQRLDDSNTYEFNEYPLGSV